MSLLFMDRGTAPHASLIAYRMRHLRYGWPAELWKRSCTLDRVNIREDVRHLVGEVEIVESSYLCGGVTENHGHRRSLKKVLELLELP